jgi:putative transposase
MTIEELERWIVRWYYADWANTAFKRLLRTSFISVERLGNTPWGRWHTMAHDQGYALPLPPSIDQWRMTRYEHDTRTLSRKTGITFRDQNFRGENLPYLLKKYGENPRPILVDPDDFRRVYVVDGDTCKIVGLVNSSVDETTPAFSFTHAKACDVAGSANPLGVVEKAGFSRDLYQRSAETSAKAAKKKQKPKEASRETKRTGAPY